MDRDLPLMIDRKSDNERHPGNSRQELRRQVAAPQQRPWIPDLYHRYLSQRNILKKMSSWQYRSLGILRHLCKLSFSCGLVTRTKVSTGRVLVSRHSVQLDIANCQCRHLVYLTGDNKHMEYGISSRLASTLYGDTKSSSTPEWSNMNRKGQGQKNPLGDTRRGRMHRSWNRLKKWKLHFEVKAESNWNMNSCEFISCRV